MRVYRVAHKNPIGFSSSLWEGYPTDLTDGENYLYIRHNGSVVEGDNS